MKFITFEKDGRTSVGIIRQNRVIDLGGRLGHEAYSLDALLEQGLLDQAVSLAEQNSSGYDLNEVRLLKPVLRPGKIICVGVNYANRNAEYKDKSELPKYPSIFMRTPGSFVAHGEDLMRPPESEQLDYEGEIAVIVGKPGRRIPEHRARDHIAGFTVMNEATLRDWVRHAKFNVTQGKNFERLGAYGPWMVTSDQFEDLGALHLQTRVNGEVRQDDTTASMMFPIPYLVHYISTFTALEPGDIIATGTPTGAGARFDPPRFLKPGDMVEVEVDGLGCLSNGVADERL